MRYAGKSGEKMKVITNKTVIDEWSIIHFITGFILARLKVNIIIIGIVVIIFEIIEPYFPKLHGNESHINVVSDCIIGFIGALIGRV